MKRIVLMMATIVGAVSCAPAPRAMTDRLEATAPGEFRYVATASMLHPLNSGQGEQARLARLGERLAEAGLCPKGYEIVGRDPPAPLRVKGYEDEYAVRDVIYVGRCRS